MDTTKYPLNALPDPEDSRDYKFTIGVGDYEALPTQIDLRSYAGEIEQQGWTDSCVANAVVSALELLSTKHSNYINLSRLFLYYNIREPYPDFVDVDKGSYLRDGFKSISQVGICSEDTWSFDLGKVNTKPDEASYAEALNHMVQRYERIEGFAYTPTNVGDPILSVKVALAKGYPVTISMLLGQSFYDITGSLAEQNYTGVGEDYIGGHAMCIVGYDDDLDGFIVENSWGSSWGDNGFFLLKYEVLTADCLDVWVCTAFDGITFEPEWNDNSPDITVDRDKIIITHYQEDGLVFNAVANILTGHAPFTVTWYYPNTGTATGNPTLPEITYTMPEGVSGSIVAICDIISSGLLIKKKRVEFVFKYIDEAKPVPVITLNEDTLDITITSLFYQSILYDVELKFDPSNNTWFLLTATPK